MDIEGFWKDAPDKVFDVEPLWNNFVESLKDGQRVDDYLSKSPNFNNADYVFKNDSIVIELKEIVEDFMSNKRFINKYIELVNKVVQENPSWKPSMLGGDGKMPDWFFKEFIKICRRPLDNILKKANKQLRETKEYFNIECNTGVVVIVNDGFVSLEHLYIQATISNLLVYSYSSIDCLVYTTVNRYVEIEGTDIPRLLWVPMYSEKASDDLADFINELGKEWFNYLEKELEQPWTDKIITDDGAEYLKKAKSIRLPSEEWKPQF